MMAAAGVEKEEVEAGSCPLFRCLCCWRRACSPRIPRVAPGMEYLCIPAGADNSPAWSLLVGFLSDSNSINDSVLGLHRFRVARSGRILGRSDDTLDILRTFRTSKGCSAIASVSAELTPDGCSLCLFSEHLDPGMASAIPQANELRVTYNTKDSGNRKPRKITMSSLPRIPPDSPKKCRPVSAAGHVWAPNIKLDVPTSTCFLGMLRLNRNAKRWEKAGDTFSFPLKREEVFNSPWGGPLFQGYAVLHNDTILVSLRADQGLLTFNCLDCTWTEVTTTKDTHAAYTPILGRGVYVEKFVTKQEEQEEEKLKEEDYGSVYFLRDNRIFAYKLRYDQDQKRDGRKLRLEPPAMIDYVCPFYKEGYGFLTHLGGRLMCSVWISTLLRCSCDYLHVLITTFQLRSSREQKGIDILHSTCRRLRVFPIGLPMHEFCFLQEYNDKSAVKPSTRDYTTSSHVTKESSKMLHCCSNFLSELGCYKFEDPPKDPARQINKHLYIICKAGPQLIVYLAEIENGRLKSHDNLLEKKYELTLSHDVNGYHVLKKLPPWHLVFSSGSSKIYAVSNTQDDIHEYSLMEEPKTVRCIKPTSHRLSMVFEVGDKIIAVSYTLHVFYLQSEGMSSKWVCCSNQTDVLKGKANLSGYAVVDRNSFIVSDADTCSFLLFDLGSKRWSVLQHALPAAKLLNGRSVLVDGFIYTCTSGGLLAYDYELVQHGNNHKDLLDPIFLQFSWQFSHGMSWVAERMCLDCADKGENSDAVVFCVVQGEYCYSTPPGGSSISHDVHITTVQVKTERIHSGKRKPDRIDHVGIGTCFINHEAALVCTKSCFTVGS